MGLPTHCAGAPLFPRMLIMGKGKDMQNDEERKKERRERERERRGATEREKETEKARETDREQTRSMSSCLEGGADSPKQQSNHLKRCFNEAAWGG